jgi:hypothetical protein
VPNKRGEKKNRNLLESTSPNQIHFPRSEYAEVEGRTFLLVVGLGYQLLGSILQTGGCAARPKGKIRPDPFYVDQVSNIDN